MSEIEKRPTAEEWAEKIQRCCDDRPRFTPGHEAARFYAARVIESAESAAYAEGREAGIEEAAQRAESYGDYMSSSFAGIHIRTALKRPPDSTPATTAPRAAEVKIGGDQERLSSRSPVCEADQGANTAGRSSSSPTSPPLTESRVIERKIEGMCSTVEAYIYKRLAALESPRAPSKADAIREEIVAIVREHFTSYLPSYKCGNTIAGWGNKLRDLLDRLDEAQKDEA